MTSSQLPNQPLKASASPAQQAGAGVNLPRQPPQPELIHACRVATDGEDYWLVCSCGFVSVAYPRYSQAREAWCLIDEELRQSAQRRAVLRSLGVSV